MKKTDINYFDKSALKTPKSNIFSTAKKDKNKEKRKYTNSAIIDNNSFMNNINDNKSVINEKI